MEPYDEFLQRVQDIHRLSALQGHLGWDQEVLMPTKGASSRGEMMAWLAGKRHEQVTDSRMGELLDFLEAGTLDADQAANVREMRRTYDKRFVSQNPSSKPSLKHAQRRCWHGSLLEQIRILRRSNLRSVISLNSREKKSIFLASHPRRTMSFLMNTKSV